MVTMSNVHAADLSTYAFLAVAPNPVGLGQSVDLTMWLSNIPPLDAQGWAIPWADFIIDVTKPDGTKQTLGPFASDPVGSQWAKYTPDMIGDYTFKLSYTGQTIGSTNYKSSMSSQVVLKVQQDEIQYLPSTPLPDGYWQRPIYAENTEWASISGNWLQAGYNISYRGTSGFFGDGGAFNPYTTAPETAHVLWTRPIALGGLTGGEFGDINFYTGLTYEGKWAPPIIINGRLYYNTPLGTSSFQGFQCVDLRTGETLWTQNTSSYNNGGPLTLGQLYDYESPNQHGVIPYLWSCHTDTWIMYDAYSGEQILTLANATYGKFVMSPNGDMLVYILNGARNWLAMWNSSLIKGMLDGTSGTLAWQWRPRGGSQLDWNTGIQWNVTVPDVPGSQSINQIADDVVLASTASTNVQQTWVDIGYSASTGEQLWVKNRTALAGDVPLIFGGNFPRPYGDGVYVMFAKETMKWYGFSIATGDALWETEPMSNAWATYPAGGVIAYGKLYTCGYDGMVHCYDVKNGAHLWDYYGGNSGMETPYGHYPFFGGITVADGKVYVATNEHSPGAPVWKGEKLHAIDAETGEGIWTVSGLWSGSGGGRGAGMGPAVVADGYLLSVNGNDNQIYCFGKGQTATTITASPTVSAQGSTVLLTGTITDQSPGDTCLGIPAAGTPAIADDVMTDWMEYLYMQQPKPTNATGVQVHLTAIDPNGNFQDIANVTSDTDGVFGLAWTPPVPGLYKVTAAFEGSKSYFSSHAVTMFAVSTAPSAAPIVTQVPSVTPLPTQTAAPTPAPTQTPPPSPVPQPTSGLPTTTYIAIAAAVVIISVVAAAVAFTLRRRQ
jgi:hypothetical protein